MCICMMKLSVNVMTCLRVCGGTDNKNVFTFPVNIKGTDGVKESMEGGMRGEVLIMPQGKI